ncbi:uncharacterized protein LOC128132917 [Lactuca sativa]|uniref:uncharacterized protein LOC128132917 n=1 Tax=Lactuca sativa TaxID=4236 RepID=UPI0022AF8C2A|nr:uncharacterized protein LOC128132917 [Lactuca sativa]
MDRLHVPIMADSILSSIATFHTTKISVTDPTKYSFIGSIPEAMLARISTLSNVLQQYMKLPSSGPRELTPAMVRSIEEADKPAKRVKKNDTQMEALSSKPTKGKTPKKRKSDKAATSQAQPKKQKKPARSLILQSSSDSDSEYVPPKHRNAPPSESEGESFDEEASGRGDTPPRSPTPEIPIRFYPPSPPPVTIPVSIPPIFPIPTPQPFTTIPIPTPIFTNTTTTTTTTGAHSTAPNPPVTTKPPATTKSLSPTQSTETTPILGGEDLKFDSTTSLSVAAKAIEASTSQCQQASLAVDASTKECKEATAKVYKLVSEAHLFLDSLQAAAKKNAQTVNTSVEKLQRSLQYERSNLEATRQAIEAANETLHANVNDRLTQLEAELAVENRIMDELDRRTSQLKMQNYKLRTATTEVNDLKSEREVIRSFVADVHSILLHLLEAHDPIITITIRRHLADKLRPALDILSRNEASVSNKEKKKKKIGEDDTENEDDVYAKYPKKPFQKVKSSEKEMEENYKKQKAELE